MTSPNVEAPRRAILAAALDRVPFEGWTWPTVTRAAADAGYDPAMARRCFPRGLGDVLAFFLAEADRLMLADLAVRDVAPMRVRDRIATAVRVRLERHAPHRDAVRRALALLATPQHAPTAVAALARTVDAIWRAAGDTATDFNWYTKRGLLAGVYSATVLCWLDDASEDCRATWAFLDRRIDDVMTIQRLRGRAEKALAGLDAPLKAFLARRGPRAAADWQPPKAPSPPAP